MKEVWRLVGEQVKEEVTLPHGMWNLVLFVDVCGSCLGAPMADQGLVFWVEQYPCQKK